MNAMTNDITEYLYKYVMNNNSKELKKGFTTIVNKAKKALEKSAA